MLIEAAKLAPGYSHDLALIRDRELQRGHRNRATLAVAMKLIEQGRIPRDESIVICITGNGLKTLEAVAADLPQPEVIEARLSEFDRLLEHNKQSAAAPAAPPATLPKPTQLAGV